MRTMTGAILVAVLGGCQTEYGIQTVDPNAGPSGGEIVAQGVRGPQAAAQAPTTGGSAPADRPRKPRRPRSDVQAQEVPLGGGARSDVVDFLFVVDGSASMKHVVEQVYAGFDALIDEDAFPKDARIAVTSTLPAMPDHPNVIHTGVNHRGEARLEPGFQRLVDKEGIERYRSGVPERAAEFALEGCAPWTSPRDTNADGVPCFQAHTQLSLAGVGVEAGLTSVHQLLQRGPLFRTGAAANIVFVSDTQDPGIPATNRAYADLVSIRPTGDVIADTAANQQLTSSLRLHAIAPTTECGSEKSAHIGDVYGDAARATGGHALDLCGATPESYVALVRDIVRDGAVPTAPVVPLARQDRVRAVFVDGVEVPYHLSRDKKAVVLDSGMPAAPANVRVEYRTPSMTVRPDAHTAR